MYIGEVACKAGQSRFRDRQLRSATTPTLIISLGFSANSFMAQVREEVTFDFEGHLIDS